MGGRPREVGLDGWPGKKEALFFVCQSPTQISLAGGGAVRDYMAMTTQGHVVIKILRFAIERVEHEDLGDSPGSEGMA